MSIDEIINELDRMRFILERKRDREKTGTGIWQTSNDRVVALSETISLLRTHPDSQPNKPLTLEELREMNGRPVYLSLDKRWYILTVNNAQPCLLDLWGAGTHLRLLSECGMYLRPPKEAET